MTTELELFLNTGTLAALSALAAVGFGIPLGLFLLGLSGQIRAIASALFAVPFLLPAFLIGITALPLSESLPWDWFWVVAAHAFMNAGFIGLVVAAAVSGIPGQQIEQALLDGASRRQLFLQIVLPQISGAVVGASLLVALYSATSFGLVISLGQGRISTLETEIAQRVLYGLDFEAGIVLALLQTLLTLLLVFAAGRSASTGFANLFGQSPYKFRLMPMSALIGATYILIFSFFVSSIFVRADLPNGFVLLNTRGARDILNVSVFEAATNSLRNLAISLLISIPVAWWLATRKTKLVSRLILIPVGISPVVIGLLFLILAGYVIGSGIDGFILLALAQALMLIPLIYQVIKPALEAQDSEIIDAARLDGAGQVRTWVSVTVPMLKKPILVSIAFASLASLGEFGAASFLAYGSNTTLPLVMFQLASRPGSVNVSMAMTIALLYLLLSAFVVYLVSREQKAN